MTRVERVGPERAAEVLALIRDAFGARIVLDPPSAALGETEESIAAALGAGGGLMAFDDLGPSGALLLSPERDLLGLRRVSVHPDRQGLGVAPTLVRHAESLAAGAGLAGVRVTARAELPRTVRFWQRLGYTVVDRDGPLLTLTRLLPVRTEVATAEDARALGARLARVLRAGDVLVLSGDLGAGKTTLTQGLGEGLGVRGPVTSPTFVIARVHPSLDHGPALVHVDAYRLGGVAELDDLDLDTALEDAVTVVEWGEGLAEGLADTRLEVRLTRADEAAEDLDPRTVRVQPVGHRWVEAARDLRAAVTG